MQQRGGGFRPEEIELLEELICTHKIDFSSRQDRELWDRIVKDFNGQQIGEPRTAVQLKKKAYRLRHAKKHQQAAA